MQGSSLNNSRAAGVVKLQTLYGETLPNVIYSNDKKLNLESITKTVGIRGTSVPILDNDNAKTIDLNLNKDFVKQHSECENVGNGDQFSHLSSLAGSIDTKSRLRCGWVYNTSDYTQGRGALGTSSGPIKTDASGTWIWNLDDAKKKLHTDICKRVQDCGDIGASIYQGKCGWCERSGKAVPINRNGLAYPFDTNTACPPKSLVSSSGACSAPRANRVEGFVNPSACQTTSNGAYPRDCLLQKVASAGCSDSGSLYQALSAGSDNDYTNVLRQQQAWSVYQSRASMPLDDTGLRTGKITIADALNGFGRVQDHAASSANGGLQFAARDLCYNKGVMDTYDFCSEISDASNGPFSIDCLQKVFLQQGGQITGKLYPSPYNVAKWNSIGTWATVKAAILKLKEDSNSSDRVKQESAMLDFLGITLEDKKKPLGALQIMEATYGMNCNPSLRGNRTKLFSDLVAGGNNLANYSYDYTKTGGDPAGGCGKTLEIKYNCSGGPTKVFTVPPEAGFNGQVKLQC